MQNTFWSKIARSPVRGKIRKDNVEGIELYLNRVKSWKDGKA